MTAIDIIKILKLPPGSTEVFPGPAGKIIVCLHKKPERTPEVLKKIESAFIEASKRAQIYAEVEIIGSDEKDWHEI